MLTQDTSTKLRGINSIKLTKIASTNEQGMGIAYDFTIDKADKAKKMLISFDYMEGTSGDYTDGDARVFIYDKDNSKLIRVNGEDIKANTGMATHYAQFQTAADSDDYRLIIHIADAGTSGTDDWELFLDNISVAPIAVNTSATSSNDEVVCVVRGLSGTHATNTGDWYQIESFNTPEIDTTNSWDSANDKYVIPETGYYDMSFSGKIEDENASPYDMGACLITYYINGVQGAYFGQNYDNENTSVASGAGRQLSGFCSVIAVPFNKGDEIEIWIYYQGGDASNNVTTSGQYTWFQIAKRNSVAPVNIGASGRDVIFRGTHQTATNVPHNTVTTIPWDRTRDNIDTASGYDASSNAYTIPETGYYDIGARVTYSSSEHWNADEWSKLYLLVDGSITEISHILESDGDTAVTFNFSNEINTMKYLTKGQVVSVQTFQNSTGTRVLEADARMNWFHLAKRQSAQTLLDDTRDVVCTARGLTGAQAITKQTDHYITTWNDPTIDTTNSYSGGAYTVPETGYYDVSGSMHIHNESATYGMGVVILYLNIDGSNDYSGRDYMDAPSSMWSGMSCDLNVTAVYLTKGQVLKFYARFDGSADQDTSNTIHEAAGSTNFTIAKRK